MNNYEFLSKNFHILRIPHNNQNNFFVCKVENGKCKEIYLNGSGRWGTFLEGKSFPSKNHAEAFIYNNNFVKLVIP